MPNNTTKGTAPTDEASPEHAEHDGLGNGTVHVLPPVKEPTLPRLALPITRLSRFPWINRWFGSSIESLTKAVNAYTGLVKAHQELNTELVKHDLAQNRLRNLDALIEADRLRIINDLAEQQRINAAADLEGKLVLADLEARLAQAQSDKARHERERERLQNKAGGKRG